MNEKIEKNVGTYVCRRIKLFSYLSERGFKPFRVVPDKTNDRFVVWLFDKTDELLEVVEEYYA